MNVLLLEDESRVVDVLTEALREAAESDGWELTIRVATHRAEALTILDDPDFPLDIAVLDLQVPASSDPAPPERRFGLNVFHELQSRSRGTKLIVFSGRADGSATTQLMDAAWTADPLGAGITSMVEFVDKEDLDDCVARVSRYGRELTALERLDVSFGAHRFELSPLDERILKICARRLAASRIRVALLPGGLSGARTVRLQLFRGGVQPFASLVAKIGSLQDVDQEHSAYNTHVSPRLDPGAFPQYADRVDAGAAGRGAIFFRLADAYAQNVLDVLQEDENAAAVAGIREKTSRWHDARAVRTQTVRDIRRLMLTDVQLAEVERLLGGLPWQTIENVSLEIHVCSHHGDLHLLNALVDDHGDVVLIDFVRADEGPASLDPVTLELSLAFHPEIASAMGGWPLVKQMTAWWDLDSYLVDCPFPRFVRSCREWAHDVSASDAEVAAVAYGYAMRQLRWPPSAEHGLALIEASIRELT